jgi:hypothetical protein
MRRKDMRDVWGPSLRGQRGSILLGSLIFIAIATMLGLALFNLAVIEASLSTGDEAWSQLLYCANAALSRVMVDTPVRMAQITTALATPGSTITWGPETLRVSPAVGQSGSFTGFACTTTTTFVDIVDPVNPTNNQRRLQATAVAPSGAQRTARIQLGFVPNTFRYALKPAISSSAELGILQGRGVGRTEPTSSTVASS